MMNFMNEDNSHTAFIISNYYIMAAPEMMTVINYNYSPYNLNQISSANRSELPFACVAAKARNEETAQAESVLNPEIFYYYTE